MKDECNKYETLFIFSDEATLNKHIEECDECRQEHEKMQRVSALIQEVKDDYRQKPAQVLAKTACVLLLFFVGGVSINTLDLHYGILDTVKYGEPLTIEDLGFPTDSYGLIQVD